MTPYRRPVWSDLSSTTTDYTRYLDENNLMVTHVTTNSSLDRDVVIGLSVLVCDPVRIGDFKTPTPWSYSYTDATFGVYTEFSRSGTSTYPNQISNSATVMPFQGDALDFGDLEGRVYDDLISKFYDKLRGDLDLSVDLFQARQSARMFNLADQVVKYTQKKSRLITKLGGAWLEFTYGLKPLVQDVYNAAKESLDYQQKRADAYRAKAKGEAEETIVRVTGSDSSGGKVTYRTYGKKQIKYSVGGTFDLSGQSDIDRFTSLNPASIAWELLPYSFVADWFLDVGGYLRNAESAVLYAHRFKNGFISRLEVTEVDYSLRISHSQLDSFRVGSGAGKFKQVNFSRGVLLGAPFPRPPRLDAKLGSGRLLNAAALLSQLLGGGSKKG